MYKRQEQHSIIDTKIRNAAMSHLIEMVGGFLTGKGVVVVDIEGLIGGLRRLAHNDMEQPFACLLYTSRCV